MAGPSLIPIFTPPTPSFNLLSNYWETANQSSYTDSSVNLGIEASGRFIVVAVSYLSGSNSRAITGITVGGSSLTEDIQNRNSGNSTNPCVAMFSGVISTGTSGDVVITLAGTVNNMMMSTYSAYNLVNNAVYDTDTASGGTSTMSINIPTKGIALGAGGGNSAVSSCTWVGLDEDNDQDDGGGYRSTASAGPLLAETGRAIEPTPSTGSIGKYCCISYN